MRKTGNAKKTRDGTREAKINIRHENQIDKEQDIIEREPSETKTAPK